MTTHDFEVRVSFVTEHRHLLVFGKPVDPLPPVGASLAFAHPLLQVLRIDRHSNTASGVRCAFTLFGSPTLVRDVGGPGALRSVMEAEGFALVGDYAMPLPTQH